MRITYKFMSPTYVTVNMDKDSDAAVEAVHLDDSGILEEETLELVDVDGNECSWLCGSARKAMAESAREKAQGKIWPGWEWGW